MVSKDKINFFNAICNFKKKLRENVNKINQDEKK